MRGVWRSYFRYDPVPALMDAGNPAVAYFARRDLLDENTPPLEGLRSLQEPKAILKKQLPDGSWPYPGRQDASLPATLKNLQSLVYQYGLDRGHPGTAGACEYLLSRQTEEGDIRGFIGNQYAPYYTGIVTALLIKAGYEEDPRITRALDWLLSVRQDDGGWVMGSPGMTPHLSREELNYLTSDRSAPTMKAFDKSMPFSHSGTGMVLRAFAAHPRYRSSPEALKAAVLLKSHFFKEDNYSSYKSAEHWVRFQYPFWWNSLLAALDSLSEMGFTPDDPDIKKALDWFIVKQQPDGLWQVSYSGIHKASQNSKTDEQRLWISLAVCRVFKRFYGGTF